jgi:hypothetical protein
VETSSNSFEYIRLDSRTKNVAVVPEGDGTTSGLNPEADIDFALEQRVVKTIAIGTTLTGYNQMARPTAADILPLTTLSQSALFHHK